MQRRAGGQQFQHVAPGLLALLDLGAFGDIAERPQPRRLAAQAQRARELFQHAAVLQIQQVAVLLAFLVAARAGLQQRRGLQQLPGQML